MNCWSCALFVAGISFANLASAFQQPLGVGSFRLYHRCVTRARYFQQVRHNRGGGPELTSIPMSTTSIAEGEKHKDDVSSTKPDKTESVSDKEDKMKVLVMYVIVRRDLQWPLGSVVAQGAHAATAVLWEVCWSIYNNVTQMSSHQLYHGRHGTKQTLCGIVKTLTGCTRLFLEQKARPNFEKLRKISLTKVGRVCFVKDWHARSSEHPCPFPFRSS